jgi:hypothetical protein
MRKTVILTETQISRIIDKIISEQGTNNQTANEFKGGADVDTVSHKFLSVNFGLPNGTKYENYYYGAKVEDVIKMSGTSDRSKYLSIFKPLNAYGNDPKDFYDYISVNNVELNDRGVKKFDFNTGNVIASHNGLLALVRAMSGMRGQGGIMTITFGRTRTGKEAEESREFSGISYDSNRALNQKSTMNLIQDVFCAAASDPKNISASVSQFKGKTPQELINFVNMWISNAVQGFYGFMTQDEEQRNKIIGKLIPKGFITKIDFDSSSIINELVTNYRNVPDLIKDTYDYYAKPKYNEQKRQSLNRFDDQYVNDLQTKVKDAYDKNFTLFVENFLPDNKAKILPQIPSSNFQMVGLGEWHYTIFNSKYGGSVETQSTISTTSGKPGKGQ